MALGINTAGASLGDIIYLNFTCAVAKPSLVLFDRCEKIAQDIESEAETGATPQLLVDARLNRQLFPCANSSR